jgi:hypothetical protein
VWRTVLLLGLAGCDLLFGLEHLEPDTQSADAAVDDARRDGRVIGDAPVDAVIQTHSSCPSGFTKPYENSSYTYVDTPMSWYDALTYCKSLDDPTSTKRVHLPVLTSDMERSTHLYVMVVGSASEYWIGLSDTAVEGVYQWVTDEQVDYPTASAWGTGEPSEGPADDCVRVAYSNNDLDSIACATPSRFVCECDDHAYDPLHYKLL